jgi:hypothetical protein
MDFSLEKPIKMGKITKLPNMDKITKASKHGQN